MTDQRDLAKEVEPVSDEALSSLLDYYSGYSEYASDIRRHVFSALRELAALRRPVQSENVEAIRAYYLNGRTENWHQSGEHVQTLLSALDQAQREIQELRDSEEADADRMERAAEALEQQTRLVADGTAQIIELRAQIARLSSPPEERGEIVERQAERRTILSRWDLFAGITAQMSIDDIDTLLQDLRRYSNAHKILLAERDEARGKVERLEGANKALASAACAVLEWAKGRMPCPAGECCAELRAQIESLSTALGAHVWANAQSSALAAADGQQEETCRCAVTCLVAKGGKTLKLDGTPYKCKGLPATRKQPSATGDGTFVGMKVVVDPSMPADQMEIRSGRNSVRVTNLGTGDGVEGE